VNAQDYISSGLLEAYVLGALSESEFEQVAGAVCRFPEVREEVALLEESLFRQAQLVAVAPPPALEERIWAQLATQAPATGAPISTIAEAPKSIPLPPPVQAEREIDLAPRRKSFPLGMAAALLLLLGSVAANYVIYQNGQQREAALTAANTQLKTEMAVRDGNLRAMQDRYRSEAEMAADPAMQTVAMRSLQAGKPMAATMYWNAGRQKAFVSVQKLPPPPDGMQYQLWAIADGKPVSLGMIDNAIASEGGMQPVQLPVAAGQAFAVSLEQAGGVPSPTADRIMLMGKVPA
jgi:anti-sigma-K factor RskA